MTTSGPSGRGAWPVSGSTLDARVGPVGDGDGTGDCPTDGLGGAGRALRALPVLQALATAIAASRAISGRDVTGSTLRRC
ncbi:MAG: hypothetical protein NVS3B26_10570 [Mycobacteriales bacterium]